jgi:hypothetical protein
VDADVKSPFVFGKIANISDLGKAASVPDKNLWGNNYPRTPKFYTATTRRMLTEALQMEYLCR